MSFPDGPVIDVIVISYLAFGKEGKVYQAKLRDTDQPVAIKCIERWEEQIVSLKKTFDFCKQLQHPNIVRHLHHQACPAISPIEPPVYQVIMELCKGGTLRYALRRIVITPYFLQKWTKEVVEGLSYLHENHCVHRDIKGENILLTSRNLNTSSVKIADLSTIAKVDEDFPGHGTAAFMAPEMITGKNLKNDAAYPGRGPSADIWSLGCVVIEMLNGTSPHFFREHDGEKFQIKGEHAVMYFVATGGFPSIPNGLPPDIHHFIERCLQRDPTERSTALKLKNHPFLTAPINILSNWMLPEPIGEILGPEELQEFSVGAQRIIPLQMTQVIASGYQSRGPSKVFMAQRTDTNDIVAVKSILLDMDPRIKERAVTKLKTHFLFVMALHHPHIVRHIHLQEAPIVSAKDPPTCQILMEFCEGLNLHQFINKFTLPCPLLQKWVKQLVEGIYYLHSQQCVHRDIKSEHILLSSENVDNCIVKICGFGTTKRLEGETTQPHELSGEQGTWCYMSPEIITGNVPDNDPIKVPGRLGRKTDIWSLGCVVIEMVTGKLPAYHRKGRDGKMVKISNDMAVMHFVAKGGAPTIPECLPPKLIMNFITHCLQRNPTDRPRAAELKGHEFLTASQEEISHWVLPPPTPESADFKVQNQPVVISAK